MRKGCLGQIYDPGISAFTKPTLKFLIKNLTQLTVVVLQKIMKVVLLGIMKDSQGRVLKVSQGMPNVAQGMLWTNLDIQWDYSSHRYLRSKL